MKFSHSFDLPTGDLILDEETRQRTDHNVDDLLPSIEHRGIYNPIIIDEHNVIVAGARRYLAAKQLGITLVPVRRSSDLNPIERQILELEENTRRKDLAWQDQAQAFLRIHQLYLQLDPLWTETATAEALNVSISFINKYIQVAEALIAGNEKVVSASGFSAAYGVLTRMRERRVEDAVADLAEVLADKREAPEDSAEAEGPSEQAKSKMDWPLRPARRSSAGAVSGGLEEPKARPTAPPAILNEDFLTWASAYEGQPFNLIHCDFPYGVGMDTSAQGETTHGTYEDSKETFTQLLLALCRNIDRLMASSAHLVFWLSSDTEIVWDAQTAFAVNVPSLTFWPRPLIWHKTDNKGIIQDAQRGPRHVYETALFASRGDRKIIKPTSDVYGCPSDKAFHQSTKPEPMLRYFFQMLVDENTRLLDPTCGSGSALRAAESLGAKVVLGLEKDPAFAQTATEELRRFRLLRRASS